MRGSWLVVFWTGLLPLFGCAPETFKRYPDASSSDARTDVDVTFGGDSSTVGETSIPDDTVSDDSGEPDATDPDGQTHEDLGGVADTEPDAGPGTGQDTDAADDTTAPRCGTDLFISEYLEGTSWNKAIEIANFTGRDVDLQGYALWKITNGGDWVEGSAHPFKLTGVLAHGAVLVVCHGSSAPPILAVCDVTTTVDFAEFNGDDAVALARNGAIIDVIGSDGADPGTGWTIAGVAEATADHTLRRKPEVIEGVDSWAASEPTWTVLDNNVIGGPGGLGELAVDGSCEVSAPRRAAINEIAAGIADGGGGEGMDFVEIAAFSGVGQVGTLDLGGWVIASTSGRYTFPAGSSVPVGGFRALSEGVLGFDLGLVDRVWVYDARDELQDVVGWNAEDLTHGASYGRIPDLTGELTGNSIATPGASNRNPDIWCGDAICQDDEDCRSCSEDCAACVPGPGELVVTEIMAAPKSGPEWFELVNATDVPLELSEVVVRDDALDFHVIAPDASRVLDARQILVLSSGTMTVAAGASLYTFSGVSLDPIADEIVIERRGVVIDRVAWASPSEPGVAWSLSGTAVDADDNDAAAAWCPAVDAFGPLQLGTPGAPNPPCSACGDTSCDPDEACDTCAADCGACPAEGCAVDLFLSEYLEGSSYNKALEVANETGAPVDLSHYALWRIVNGGSTWATLSASAKVALTGTLAHGAVWVGCNTSSEEALKAHCDALYGQGSAPTSFNGDDAVALAKDGVIIDVVGVDAVDPGMGWSVAGVEEATAGHTLVRKPTVTHGNVDWTSAADEWQVLDEDAFDGLGTHEVDYTCIP